MSSSTTVPFLCTQCSILPLFCGNGLCIKKTTTPEHVARLFWTYGNLLMDFSWTFWGVWRTARRDNAELSPAAFFHAPIVALITTAARWWKGSIYKGPAFTTANVLQTTMSHGSPDTACSREGRFLGACVKSINHEGNGKYWEASGTPKMSNLPSPEADLVKQAIEMFRKKTHEDRGIQLGWEPSFFLKRGILWSTTLSRQVEAAVQPAARFKILSLECVFWDRVTKRCACLWMCFCNKTKIYRKIIQVQFRNSYSAAVHQIEFTQGNFKRTFQFTAGWRMWDEAADKLTRRIRELQRMHQNHASMRSIPRHS